MCIVHQLLKKKSNFSQEFSGLNLGQKIAYLAALTGECLLITGGGGVGKSHLIRMMKSNMPHMVLCASTGIAGINIKGQTIDSYLGFNKQTRTIKDALKIRDPRVLERLKATRVILIDEVSMMRIDKFEMMDARLRSAKGNNLPFGGVQIIIVGDFQQLTPVLERQSAEGKAFTEQYGDRLFVFESALFKKAGFVPYLLNEYVRNGNEEQRRILRNMRMGHKLGEVVDFINKHAVGVTSDQSSLRICKVNKKVDQLNKEALQALPGIERVYYAKVSGDYPVELYPADNVVSLKKGCRVMLTVNNAEQGYMNGDLGTVLSLHDSAVEVRLDRGGRITVEPNEWENVESVVGQRGLEDRTNGTYTQLPIRLGYAITAHKSQGMTMDSAIADLSDRYNSDGLVYVVISRVTSFDGLRLLAPLRVEDIQVNKKATAFTNKVSRLALARREKDISFLKKAMPALMAA